LDDAEDAAQSAWLDFCSAPSFGKWRLLTALCYLADRHGQRSLAELVFGDAFSQPLPAALATGQSRPTTADLLRDALALVGDDERAALVLIYYGGFTLAEASSQLCLSPATTRRRVASGLRQLARLLEGGAT
jgi:DNA-directed RNA polymerase specialized sigma24 family protein